MGQICFPILIKKCPGPSALGTFVEQQEPKDKREEVGGLWLCVTQPVCRSQHKVWSCAVCQNIAHSALHHPVDCCCPDSQVGRGEGRGGQFPL